MVGDFFYGPKNSRHKKTRNNPGNFFEVPSGFKPLYELLQSSA